MKWCKADYWILPASFRNLEDFQVVCCFFWLWTINDTSTYSVTFFIALWTWLCIDEASVSVSNLEIVLITELWNGFEKGYIYLISRIYNVKHVSLKLWIRISSHLSNTSSWPWGYVPSKVKWSWIWCAVWCDVVSWLPVGKVSSLYM